MIATSKNDRYEYLDIVAGILSHFRFIPLLYGKCRDLTSGVPIASAAHEIFPSMGNQIVPEIIQEPQSG